MAVSTIRPVDHRHRPSFLLSLILIVIFPILASTNAPKTDHADAYAKKSEDNSELSKNLREEESKVSTVDESESKIKSSGDQRDKQSIKSTNSPALNKFLDDVLKAQNDLRWIDQTVQSVNREKKRRKEVHLFPMYDKETTDDQIPKDWSKPKDLCSLSDWLNSDKNPRNEQDKSGDRWIHDYKVDQKSRFNTTQNTLNLDGESSSKADARDQRRNEPKKGDAPSLESLKETILELKKSLNESEKKQRGNSKSADESSAEEEEQREPRDKHRRDVNDEVEST
ncbi:hypothetical protein K0M31_009693 [Melipona bicolor]|uniref:Uncharacterized protein n=1 Tax=Melipona bicolor TaxID=60889 RepID=A0AA40FP85_9HYME|nr:hypothetical protein K0M31_009693 [Melipona bicolor]